MKNILSCIKGCVGLLTICLNTLFWSFPIVVVSFLKFMIPVKAVRSVCTKLINAVAIRWASINNFNIDLLLPTIWDISLPDGLAADRNYIVISNHASAVDIAALQKVFNGRIPFFRFFLKSVLFWVPFLGLAWWALDYPFMKRYSKEYIMKHPERKGRDLESTKKSCEKFSDMPVSIMNFPEGTRFTPAKKARQDSPYENLLKPKAGGIGYVLTVMGKNIDSILDVTLIYPDGTPGLWTFAKGDVSRIIVHVERIPVTEQLTGDYLNDDNFRKDFQMLINEIWSRKDSLILETISGK